jgi:hypothetical protein
MGLQHASFDVLYHITTFLNADDVVSLWSTCKSLRISLANETVCKQVIRVSRDGSVLRFSTLTRFLQNTAMFTPEGQQAASGKIDYLSAVLRLHCRRRHYSNGVPVVAKALGNSTSFVYNQGVLCFLQDERISIIDVHGRTEDRFQCNLFDLFAGFAVVPDTTSLSLLHVSDGILSLSFKEENDSQHWLLAASIDLPKKQARREFGITLDATNRLFVRNDSKYLYFGTHTWESAQGHTEWAIQAVSLRKGHPFPKNLQSQRSHATPYQSITMMLNDFPGSDIGSTVDFIIHDGYFYAVTNFSSYTVIEVDWTSFFQMIRFKVDEPSPSKFQFNRSLYRRQHREGVVLDGWLSLSLQVDQATNELKIVEGRNEFPDNKEPKRTFYISTVDFSEKSLNCDDTWIPVGDMLVPHATRESRYAPEQARRSWQVHPEKENKMTPASDRRSFILAHTRFKSYNSDTNTFVEIVEDFGCCRKSGSPSRSCLRLRSGTRWESPLPLPTDTPESSLNTQCPYRTSHENYLVNGHNGYRYDPVTLWPSSGISCPDSRRAHQAFGCGQSRLGAGSKTINAVADDRSIVVLIRETRSSPSAASSGRLVVLCFDSAAGIAHDLAGCSALDEVELVEPEHNKSEEEQTASYTLRQRIDSGAGLDDQAGEEDSRVSIEQGKARDPGENPQTSSSSGSGPFPAHMTWLGDGDADPLFIDEPVDLGIPDWEDQEWRWDELPSN